MLRLEITNEKMSNGTVFFDICSDTREFCGVIEYDIQVLREETIEDDYGVFYVEPTKIEVTITGGYIEGDNLEPSELKLNSRNQKMIEDLVEKAFFNDPLSFGWSEYEPDYDDIDE